MKWGGSSWDFSRIVAPFFCKNLEYWKFIKPLRKKVEKLFLNV